MIKDKNIINLFQNSVLAQGLDREKIEEFLKSSKVDYKKYHEGEFIFHEGDVPRKLYMLIEGQIKIAKDTYLGRQLALGEITRPGDIFGEVYLFLGHKASGGLLGAFGEMVHGGHNGEKGHFFVPINAVNVPIKASTFVSVTRNSALSILNVCAAMDKFKMEAANEVGVYPPQRIFPTLDFWLKYRENRLSRKNQFLRWKHLV